MIVSAWKNSTHNNRTGAGFGIRVSLADFEHLRYWRQIIVGNSPTIIDRRIRPFTERCTEIRDKRIGLYLIKNRRHHWTKGNPTQLTLIHLGQNIYRLLLIRRRRN